MPTLKNYLGSLVSGINGARAQSDLESVTVAELYAQHSLLKHFSIPRLRFKDVELTIPVAIENLDYPDSTYQPIDQPDFIEKTKQELRTVYKVSTFNGQIEQNLNSFLQQETTQLEQKILNGDDINVAFENFTQWTAQNANQLTRNDPSIPEPVPTISEVDQALQVLRSEINERPVPGAIENLNVIVEAGQLRDYSPENLIYIKMNVTEEGMEWQTIENADGELVSKLIPE